MLTSEQILSVNDIITEDLEISEWGGTVKITTLTGTQRDKWEIDQAIRVGIDSDEKKTERMKKMNDNLKARFCVLVIVDENNNRIFTDEQAADLGAKSASALDKIYAVAARLNAITDENVEEIEKN